MQPFLLMVAGPNGAGKTTLTQWMRARGIDFGDYINPDDIARELEGSYESRVARAQQIADGRRDVCIAMKRSFSFETVMSHRSKIDVLRRAKAAGYLVHLYFIGTDDPATNIDRVAMRVADGGHDVPRDRIVARWTRSMGLLRAAIDVADAAFVFDNSATVGGLDPNRAYDRRVGTPPSAGPRLVWSKTDTQRASAQAPPWVARYALGLNPPPDIDRNIVAATDAILAEQQPDGHWVYELEADATIPAEYVLMVHYFAETPDLELERKIGVYLRRIQGAHGGWPLFHDGAFDMSASVKAYFALKMIGDDIDADHMKRARDAILTRGGAVKSNVFTRALLSLYGVVRWHSVPVMPVEIMLLPKWFPFHIDKISYWARTVIVPLLVLQALKPKAINPRGVTIDELFHEDPRSVGAPHKAPHQKWSWFLGFRAIDIVLRALEPVMPKTLRKRAIDRCVAWVTERLNGIDGLGAIYPAMENAVKMYAVLGYPPEHPDRKIARASLSKLLVIKEHEAYCQPCVSPVWDTSLAAHALLEAGGEKATAAANRGLDWVKPLQILDVKGDWIAQRPDVRPGGWAFQYNNAYYPDLDDTAVVAMAMDRARGERGATFDQSIERAREWIVGLQCKDGGFGAFDADNAWHYLNNIPFADHGALLDPPTADLTGRCLSLLAQLGERAETSEPMRRAIEWIRRDQLPEGSWYGRWGMNYIYGTWSVLCALNAAGVDRNQEMVRKAVNWLLAIQNADGGWGEDGSSYKLDYKGYEAAASTASQTAWALLGLMAVGEVEHAAVGRGIAYLAQKQGSDGLWDEQRYTATGFPRVFYLRYHGYPRYFPLWAMARYRNLKSGNSRVVSFGM